LVVARFALHDGRRQSGVGLRPGFFPRPTHPNE
jgi:hypothetical protein